MTIASQSFEKVYALRGLNMVTPDQSIDDSDKTRGQTPYTINSRIFAPQDTSDPRVAVQSRAGAGFYSQVVGETLDVSYTTVTGQSDASLGYLTRHAQRFTPTANNALTKIDLLLKTDTANDNIVVDVYEDASGNFGTLIASSSYSKSQLTGTYAYVSARFIQAPTLDTTKNYWIVAYTQEESFTGTYKLSKDSGGSNSMSSVDGGTTWSASTGGINYKVYLSTPGEVKGGIRFVTKAGIKQTLFAHGTSIYQITNESTGAITAIKTGLSSSAERVRFRIVYDKVFIVNGIDDMMKWDGTTMTTSTHTVDFPVPDNVIIYHDRAWYYSRTEPTKLYFSGIYPDLEVVDSVNYQYVPDTSSPDPITGFTVFQDQLVIFTNLSKYLLLGDDVSTLGLKQSPGGTKGAVSQEAIANGERVVYFWSQDGGAYYYDGAQDKPLGDNIQPEADQMIDLDTIDSIVINKQWRIYYRRLGDTQHRYMLLYDLRYEEWLRDTETYTRHPFAFSLEDNTLIEASSTVGAVYFAEAQNSQLGAKIKFRYWTNYKKYTSGIAKDRIKTFRAIFATPTSTITVQVGKDADFNDSANYRNVILTAAGIVYGGGETYGSPTAYYGLGTRVSQPKVSMSGRAQNTQYRFEKDVINTTVRLYGYEAMITSSRPH